MSKAPPTDLPIHSFASAAAMESFLDAEHLTLPGFHLRLFKKASGIPTVTPDECVEVALMFGWIDGKGSSYDSTSYLRRFTPRRAKSLWSQRNVAIIARLLEAGKLRPAGVAAVEEAKRDGRWDRAYAGPKNIDEPQDFTDALEAGPSAARGFFETLNRTDRYMVLLKVHTSPNDRVREKRIQSVVEGLARREVPGQTKKVKAREQERLEKKAKTQAKAKEVLKSTKSGKKKDVKAQDEDDGGEEEEEEVKAVVGKAIKKKVAKSKASATTELRAEKKKVTEIEKERTQPRRPGLRKRG